MSQVGICRISSIFIIIVFTLSVAGYSQYYFTVLQKPSPHYPGNLSIAMMYVLPGLMALLYVLMLSTYILCIIIKPRRIPEQYNLTTEEIAQFMLQPSTMGNYHTLATLTREYVKARPDLQVRERDYRHGGLRICEICSIIKPDRSHHCAICKRCIPRMDHHCHWVNNCIHEDNHKYFLQSITLGVLIGAATLIHYGLNISCACLEDDKEVTGRYRPVCLLLYVGTGLSGIISLFLIFLTLDHCSNMCRGQTSYERVYDRDHYDRGWKRNFCDIMGQGVCQWFCPIAPTKLSAEQEPLIVTVDSTSSAAWINAADGRTSTPYHRVSTSSRQSSGPLRQNSEPLRQNSEPLWESGASPNNNISTTDPTRRTSSTSAYGSDISIGQYEDTLSLQQGELTPPLVARIRTPSVLTPEDEQASPQATQQHAAQHQAAQHEATQLRP